MIADRQLAAAILARKPTAADRIDIEYDARNEFGNPWTVTLVGSGVMAVGIGAQFTDAKCKAEVSFRIRLDQHQRAAGVAPAYAKDWTATALQFERETRN